MWNLLLLLVTQLLLICFDVLSACRSWSRRCLILISPVHKQNYFHSQWFCYLPAVILLSVSWTSWLTVIYNKTHLQQIKVDSSEAHLCLLTDVTYSLINSTFRLRIKRCNIVVILGKETTEQLEDEERANKKGVRGSLKTVTSLCSPSCGEQRREVQWRDWAALTDISVASDMRLRWILLVWWSTEGQSSNSGSLVSDLMDFFSPITVHKPIYCCRTSTVHMRCISESIWSFHGRFF